MELKISFFLFVACVVFINGIPLKSEDDDGLYGDDFEGDMILSESEVNALLHPPRNGKPSRMDRWPNGVVFYTISSVYDEAQVKQIKLAMAEIEKVTCVRFREKQRKTKDYVFINDGGKGCSSAVGRKGGVQSLKLKRNDIGFGCFKLPAIVHELIHTIGFYHQQSAINRDNYVTIIKKNIKDGKKNNFNKYPTEDFGVPYDYRSLMHYNSTAFSKNGEPTIVPHDKDVTVGHTEKMTDSDIKKINRMYKCP